MKKLQGNFIRKLNRAEKEPSFPDPGGRTLGRISSSTSGTCGWRNWLSLSERIRWQWNDRMRETFKRSITKIANTG
jgi:hypothetical protein